MSEDAQGLTTAIAPSGDAAPALTAGAILRRARESAGLHVAALAVSMKVPVKKLEALEADRLDLLPDAVFVRALAASVCRTLKIDSAPVLLLLPQSSVPQFDADKRGINAPFHSPGSIKSSSVIDFLKRPTVVVVTALLLGAIALVVIPELQVPKVVSIAPGPAAAPDVPLEPPKDNKESASGAPAALTSEISEAPTKSASKPVVSDGPVVAADPALPLAPPSVPAPAPKPAPVAVATSAAPVASAPNPANAIVVVRAKGETWIDVTDAKGVVQLRKTLTAGEVAVASGALPLSVVVGRVNMTQVEVRGQAFNMDALAKDNVARFEVK